MATMKKAAPKAQKGKKVSAMRAYVDKYKNEGGLSGNVANDTLGGNSPRFNNYDGGFGGGRMNQIKDLKAAHDKKFGPNSTVDERKNGGRLKKAQNGAKTKPKSKTTLEKISSTKLKDVPEKAVNLGKKVIDKVKNTTVGDVGKGLYKMSLPGMIEEMIKKNGGTMKKKMKNGGSLSGLKASNKRVGPVDPKGAYTTVQKRTLAGAKGKASLTRDKELGATKMTAKARKKVSKKK